MKKKYFPYFVCLAILFMSCGSYRQNIMFKVTDHKLISQQVSEAESNYIIQKNDLLSLELFTNQGEKIVDPNLESEKGTTSSTTQAVTTQTYLVDNRGLVKFPLLLEVRVEGLTLRQAEELLQKEYLKFYIEPFVVLKFTNKRVVLLGAPGGQVIPLNNENMRLTEVLALAKGVENDARATNIRVLRQDKVFVVDFSTLEGYLKNNMIIQPGDIVYVEPIRRAFLEGLRDYGPVITIISSLGTLIIVSIQLSK